MTHGSLALALDPADMPAIPRHPDRAHHQAEIIPFPMKGSTSARTIIGSVRIRRFLQTDPMGLMGGANLYRYVMNSPSNAVDPLGLWTIGNHQRLIDEVFTGYSDQQRQWMHDGSDYLDNQFQAPEYAFMHAMRNATTGQQWADALAQMLAFVRSRIAAYRRLRCLGGAGNERAAFFLLGTAAHALSDLASETHRNHRWWGMGGTLQHDPSGLTWHITGDIQTGNADSWSLAIAYLQELSYAIQ